MSTSRIITEQHLKKLLNLLEEKEYVPLEGSKNIPYMCEVSCKLTDNSECTVVYFNDKYYRRDLTEDNIIRFEVINKEDVIGYYLPLGPNVTYFNPPDKSYRKRMSFIVDAVHEVESEYRALHGKDSSYESFCYKIRVYMLDCIDFINNYDDALLIARKYLKGKRKITPPFTRKRKEEARKKRKMLSNIPSELLSFLDEQSSNPLLQQYKDGNEKAINAFVGQIIKFVKQNSLPLEASVIKTIVFNHYSLT